MAQENSFVSQSSTTYNSELIRQNHKHEQTINKQDHDFQLELQQRQFDHENQLKDKELGLFGKLFGCGESSSKNIALVICILLLLGATIISCIAYFNNADVEFIGNIWNKVIPVVTLSLGYIFGKH